MTARPRGYRVDGRKLREARLAARLSPEELGARVGLSSGWTVRALERESRGASLDLVVKLERELGVTAAQLGADIPDRVAAGVPAGEVNWDLITQLAAKPHKHLNIVEGADYFLVVDGVRDDCCGGIGEVMQEARAVQHLCDLAGVPEGQGYSAHIDARVYLLMAEVFRLRDRLGRLGGWHARETGPNGMVGDFCTECGHRWPCDSRRMADGTYIDPEGP